MNILKIILNFQDMHYFLIQCTYLMKYQLQYLLENQEKNKHFLLIFIKNIFALTEIKHAF